MQSYSYRQFDAPGHYTVYLTPGVEYTIWPCYYPYTNPLQQYVKSDWQTFICPDDPIVKNLIVKPGVLVTLDSLDPLSPSVEGTHVCSVPYYPPGSFDRGGNAIVFYPDEVQHGYYPSMPYSGSLELLGQHPFTRYYPQSVGQLMQYSCSGKFVDDDTPKQTFQRLVPLDDLAADYSWDVPGGLGWNAFPRTPDNRLPNNPNVKVEASFDSSMLVSQYPQGWIRMNGVTSSQQLTPTNNYTAVFQFPIPECGPLDLRGEYLLPLQGYQNEWRPLASFLRRTSASNGDLTGGGRIDLSDVAFFSQTYGKCPGDAGYLVCANYSANVDPASDCIELADLTAFVQIFQNPAPAKSNAVQEGIRGTLSFRQLESGAIQFVLDAPEAWTACLAQFTLAAAPTGSLSWVPAAEAIDRSVLAMSDSGGEPACTLIVIGPGGPGETVLGSVAGADKTQLSGLHLLQLGIAGKDDGADGPTAEGRAHLAEICPNPFNPGTTVSFDLPYAQAVSLAIYDLAGRTVRTLLHRSERSAGNHTIRWDGRDESGGAVAAGVYLCRLKGDGMSDTKRLTLLK